MRLFGQRVPLLLLIAMTLLVVVAFIAIVGNIFTPYTPTQQTLTTRLKPPSFMAGGDPRFFLGTDNLGRDLVARLISGASMSFSVSIAGTVLGALFGTAVGFLAARFRGLTEELLMMLVDLQASLPFILIALTMLAFFGNNLVLFIILMGLFGWEYYARLVARRSCCRPRTNPMPKPCAPLARQTGAFMRVTSCPMSSAR